MTNRKMDIACPGTYRKYSTFEELEEMNVVVREYVDQIKAMDLRSDLKQGLISLLKKLKEYSCVFFGVSWRTMNEWKNDFKVSYKTIARRLERLEEMGVIQIINSKRPSNMNQTSNIVRILKPSTENEKSLFGMIPGEVDQEENELDSIIDAAQPFEQEMTNDNMTSLFAEMPMEQGLQEEMSDKLVEKCPTIKTSSSLKQNIINDLKERYTKTTSKLLNFVPKVFKETAAILNTTDKNIYELWNVVKQVNKNYGLTKDEIRTLAIEGFNILKGLLKDSYKEGHEKIHNMFGKFNRIMHNVINEYLGNKDDQNNPSVKNLVLYDYITAEDQEEVESHWLTGEPIKKELPFYNWLEA